MSHQHKMANKARAKREAKKNEPAKAKHRKLPWGNAGTPNQAALIAKARREEAQKEAAKIKKDREKEARVFGKVRVKRVRNPVHSTGS